MFGLLTAGLDIFLLVVPKVCEFNKTSRFFLFIQNHKWSLSLFTAIIINCLVIILLVPYTETPQIYDITAEPMQASAKVGTLVYKVKVETNKTVNDIKIYVNDVETALMSYFGNTQNGRVFSTEIELQQSLNEYIVSAGILYPNDNIIFENSIVETIRLSTEEAQTEEPGIKNEVAEPTVTLPIVTPQDEVKNETETAPIPIPETITVPESNDNAVPDAAPETEPEVTPTPYPETETNSGAEEVETEPTPMPEPETKPESNPSIEADPTPDLETDSAKEPESTPGNTELTVSGSYEEKPLSFTDIDAVIYAVTSFEVEKVTISSSMNTESYGPWNMKSSDGIHWTFDADFYEAGDFLITIQAYSSDGQVATDQLTISYPFYDFLNERQ